MKVNFNVNVTDFNGNEIKMNGKPVVISEEIQKVLFFAGNTGNSHLTNDEKYTAYKIGKRLAGNETEYTSEDLSFIKRMAGTSMAAGLYGFLCDLIENDN